ncbi:MAG: CocE/NonD family hydrolase [Opitutaceae bacterium]
MTISISQVGAVHGANELDARPPYRMVEFPSEGALLRGRLYLPEGRTGRLPIIVMAHGYSATINGMVADRYAERYVGAGFAVLLYDHRNFGISGGEPRQEVNIWTQARGYLDALDYVTRLSEIDTERIAIWGDSMSAGEVIVVAAVDPRVKAVVAQIPSCGDDPPTDDPDGTLFASIRDTLLNGDIQATPETTVGPLPVVSYAPEMVPSIMKPISAFRWFIDYGAQYGTKWENRVTHVTPAVPVGFSPGICVPHIKVPLLMVVAYEDEMPYCSADVARHVYGMAPGPKRLHQLGGGHFGLLYYPSPLFEDASRVQIDFLREHFE